jgi:site-specific DNA-methyltransferase (adenine-specific)
MEKSSNTTSTLWRKEPSVERWNNIQKTERELQWCQICEMSKRVFINGKERWICNGTQNCNGEALREMFDKNGSCPSYRPQPEQQFNRELNAIQEQWGTQACREVIENWKKIGTALKPSFEPIIVARKPFKGTLVDNIIENGVGGINIDECRVKHNGENLSRPFNEYKNEHLYGKYEKKGNPNNISDKLGRFPANVIHDGSNEVCEGFPNTKGFYRPNCKEKSYNQSSNIKLGGGNVSSQYNDSGSASRYFYCAKASKKDRDEGLTEFESKTVNDGRQKSIDNAFQRGETLRKNTHPTVKPTELMQYLVRLVAPKGATILDPFNGSGSTGKAVMYENKERNANYKYIGIELNEEYLEIADTRIDFVNKIKNNEKFEQLTF